MAEATTLDHLNFTVTDLDESVSFYGEMFGFEPVEHGTMDDGTRWSIVRSGPSMLCMYEDAARVAPAEDTDHHTLSHFGLRVHDEGEWTDTLGRTGHPVMYGGPVRWPRSTAWYIHDPSGWTIEVALWDDDRVQF